MLHRAIFGSIERFLGILIEHYAGALPLWLAPVQVAVIPIADRHKEAAAEFAGELKSVGGRVEVMDQNEPMKVKIAKAQSQKIPYMVVLGDKESVIYGKGYIEDTLCGCTFRISPKSFYQVNPVQTEILYQTAIDYAGLTGKETVIDAYCGIGTIGLIAAKKAGKVIGVELNKDAVKDARINAKENKITNAAFYQGDAGRFMVEMAAKGEKADVVFMDPPRAGSDERFLSSVVKLSPKKVIYISCNPETLARDLKYLTKHHYKVEKIQPVDMFPFCDHCETVCSLSRK